jgi:hypothetical protein
LDVPVGNLAVQYAATVVGRTDPAPVSDHDLSVYLRPSRYAELDKLFGYAATEFGDTLLPQTCWRGCLFGVPG